MTKHTPGPWHLYTGWETGDHVAVSFNYSPHGRATICQMPVPGKLKQEQINANAVLIACAPEMFEALKAVKAMFDNDFDVDIQEIKTATYLQIEEIIERTNK